MKITGVKTHLYQMDLERPLGDANNPNGRKKSAQLAVFLETDEGLRGNSVATPQSREYIHSMVRGLLLGADPAGVRGLWEKMVRFAFKGGNRGIVTDAISALDVAIWDLKGKKNGEPLWKTLGAGRRKVRVYASGIDMPLTDEALFQFYEKQAKKGICAGKLKVGLDRERDLERIGIMKKGLGKSGKNPLLCIDANEYWSAKQAIQCIQFFEKTHDLTWAEEPARRWDYRGLRKVSRSIRTAVATGENLDELSEFTPLVANEGVDVVQISGGASGITGAFQVADLAHAFDLPVAMMNCPGNFLAHLAAALPNHLMMEILDVGRGAVMEADNRIEDGRIILGDEPGLGIRFREDKLREFAVEKPAPEAGPTPWGRRKGAGLIPIPPEAEEREAEEASQGAVSEDP